MAWGIKMILCRGSFVSPVLPSQHATMHFGVFLNGTVLKVSWAVKPLSGRRGVPVQGEFPPLPRRNGRDIDGRVTGVQEKNADVVVEMCNVDE
jgi:hypothetical protein